MAKDTTIGRLLLENALPPDVRPALGTLDKKGTRALAALLAAKGGDVYRDAMAKLYQVGKAGGYESGGYSFGPAEMEPGPETARLRAELDEKVRKILSDKRLSPKQRDAQLIKASIEAMDPLKETAFAEAKRNKNPLALQVESGAKGNVGNLKALVAGDTLYADQNYNAIPIPVRHSFAEGLRPAEYFAGSFGARQSIGLTKIGTASGGFLSKRIQNIAHRLVVVAPDGPAPATGVPTGLPVDTTDPDNENALLAHPAGGYARNTVLTRHVLGDLQKRGINKILVRSPMVGGPADGGVYGADVGIRERGGISPVGDHVGRAASDATAEPIVQTIIGCLSIGTMVRMADGSSKAIQNISVGERVLGADGSGRTFPVDVTHVFDNGIKDCVRTKFKSSDYEKSLILESTADHKVLAATWMATGEETIFNDTPRQLPVGKSADSFFAVTTYPVLNDNWRRVSQTSIGKRHTYDIEVDHDDHLFVLANGLIVSNSKHGGGVAGAAKAQEGFPVIERLFSAPAAYPGAVHAQSDGIVTAVRPAPQGGNYIVVDGHENYAPPEREVTAKPGQRVEAGDPLTDGPLNPTELVTHKGIGEARKQFVEEFGRIARANGFRPNRRNLELIARGYIDHVTLDKEIDDYVPGEVASYTALAAHYKPRHGAETVSPKDAVGKYLETPTLHLTIGTRVVPSHLPLMKEHGVDKVTVHPDPPPFTPLLVRTNDAMAKDRDWTVQQLGSNLYTSLINSTSRGATADPSGTSYVPALAEGIRFSNPDFKSTGWKSPG